MAQLDGLRAFAVMAVVIHHYTPGGWDYGADSGVKLFFTLSGFVITGTDHFKAWADAFCFRSGVIQDMGFSSRFASFRRHPSCLIHTGF